MYITETEIRVRYGETDQMGYAYYGVYAQYFEVARVEALRNLGVSYKQFEKEGILMPVLEYKSKFIKPAYYDDVLKIKTIISELPLARINFIYEVHNQQKKLVNLGETTLVFISKETMKPCRAPEKLLELLAHYIK